MDKKETKRNNTYKKIIILVIIIIIILLLLKFCTKKTYILTINYNNATEELKIELEENESYELIIPSKDGYTFDGWDIIGENSKIENNIFIMGKEDTSINAKWTISSYKISYELNGGTQEQEEINNYTENTETFTLPIPNKAGYTFDGWYNNKDFDGQAETQIEKGTKNNKTYYAKWEPVVYEVEYDLNGGTTDKPLIKEYTIETDSFELAVPTKKDYIFVGWTGSNLSDKSLNVSIEKGTIGSKKFIANWKPIKYSISYDLNGGVLTGNIIDSFTASTNTFSLPKPEKKGYTFLGWYQNADLTGNKITEVKKGTRENKKYYASWEVATYNIKYNLNGGNVNAPLPVTYNINSNTMTIPNPIKEHYIFTGWKESNSISTIKNLTIKKGSYGNKEFIANYEPLNYQITYKINGGILNDSINKYNIETKNFDLPIPIKDGYKFVGWYTNKDFDGEIIKEIKSGTTGDKTYYAKWELVSYEINYELNDGNQEENPITTYTIETSKFNLPLPTKNGYNFKGWYEKSDFSSKALVQQEEGKFGNKTYYAKWEKYKDYNNSTIIEMMEEQYSYDDEQSLFVTSSAGINFLDKSSISNGNGIYIMSSTKNDEYPIYYYRGAVPNNNVVFGKYCWKILRTTETGGIKLVYNGLLKSDGTCSNVGSNTQIYSSKTFNPTNIGMAGAGYSYTEKTKLKLNAKNDKNITEGTIFANDIEYDKEKGIYNLIGDKVKTSTNFTEEKDNKIKEHHYTCFKTTEDGCSSVYYVYMSRDAQIFYVTLTDGQKIDNLLKIEFDGNSTNNTKSTIQTTIETWYKDNMNDLTNYLEDTVFCNDRSLYNPWTLTSSIANDNDIKMHFATKARVAYTGKPTVKCAYKADSFTVDSKNGNGKLTYPIGLITFDEANLAGFSWNQVSDDNYLYTDRVWWTMSPGFVSATGVYNGVIHSTLDHVAVNYVGSSGVAGGVRPSISLKSNIKIISGDGTSDNPFILEDNK
ncbi:MAG: InlB B-repeat-containing protein [Bacilli bacterium]|nr:InlB B-repeat-containing protein [Bacilli bacterium]